MNFPSTPAIESLAVCFCASITPLWMTLSTRTPLYVKNLPNSCEIEITALDKASKKLDNISKSLNPMRGKVGRVGKAFDDVDKSIGKVEKSSGGLDGSHRSMACTFCRME